MALTASFALRIISIGMQQEFFLNWFSHQACEHIPEVLTERNLTLALEMILYRNKRYLVNFCLQKALA